jgi:hypothetical protein
VSPFENAFQIRTHRLDQESNDENEGSSLKSIGRVHPIAAYEDGTAAVRRRERSFRSGKLRP